MTMPLINSQAYRRIQSRLAYFRSLSGAGTSFKKDSTNFELYSCIGELVMLYSEFERNVDRTYVNLVGFGSIYKNLYGTETNIDFSSDKSGYIKFRDLLRKLSKQTKSSTIDYDSRSIDRFVQRSITLKMARDAIVHQTYSIFSSFKDQIVIMIHSDKFKSQFCERDYFFIQADIEVQILECYELNQEISEISDKFMNYLHHETFVVKGLKPARPAGSEDE